MDKQAGLNLLVVLLFAVVILLILLPAEVGMVQEFTGEFIGPYGDEYGIDENVQGIIADYSVYICPPAVVIIFMMAWIALNERKEN